MDHIGNSTRSHCQSKPGACEVSDAVFPAQDNDLFSIHASTTYNIGRNGVLAIDGAICCPRVWVGLSIGGTTRFGLKGAANGPFGVSIAPHVSSLREGSMRVPSVTY